jgi:hypothetical protein
MIVRPRQQVPHYRTFPRHGAADNRRVVDGGHGNNVPLSLGHPY